MLCNVLMQVDDMKGFRDLLRVSVEDFNFLLEKVAPHITKKDKTLRKAISRKGQAFCHTTVFGNR